MQRASREVISNDQGAKQIHRAVIVHSSNSSFSASVVQGFTTPANSGNDFQTISRRAIKCIKFFSGYKILV